MNMESNYVSKMLKVWNLEEFYEKFESEGIDEESFDLLDADTIRILFPKAGPRLKFSSKFKDYIVKKASESQPDITLMPEKSTMPLQPSEMETIDSRLDPLQPSEMETIDSKLDPSTFDSNLAPSPAMLLEPIQINGSPSSSLPLSSCSYESTSSLNFNLLKLVKIKLPEVFELLREGDPSKISYLHKLALNRLVVDTYVEKNGIKISTIEKINLAKSIIQCFPVLKGAEGHGYEQFFCPGTKGLVASGFIAQRLKNYRYRNFSNFEKAELGIGYRKKTVDSASVLVGEEDLSVEFLQKQYWLKVNDSPSSKVLQFMKDTFLGRRYNINNGLYERILETWPKLIHPDVIDAEFVQLYDPHRSDSLCLEFEVISGQFILQARNCGRKAAEDLVKEFNLTGPSTEKICCALRLLPFLLPQGVIIVQNGNKRTKIKPTNSQDHFIQFIPVGAGIDKFMKEDRTLRGERTQPFILAIGENFQPHQTFVILEDKCIETNSLLKAVDLCFKLFYVLNLQFPPYCQNVWHFLNSTFYQCGSISRLPSCVVELKNRLFVPAHTET